MRLLGRLIERFTGWHLVSPTEWASWTKYPALPPKMHLHRNPTRKPKVTLEEIGERLNQKGE